MSVKLKYKTNLNSGIYVLEHFLFVSLEKDYEKSLGCGNFVKDYMKSFGWENYRRTIRNPWGVAILR